MNKKLMSLSLSSVMAASVSLSPLAHAGENPFAMQAVSSPTLLAEAGEKMKDGKCGEGKCGSKMKEGGCSASKMKEGGCSATKAQDPAPTPKE